MVYVDVSISRFLHVLCSFPLYTSINAHLSKSHTSHTHTQCTLHTLQVDEIAFINSLQADLAAFGFETKLKKGEARRLRHQQERATQPLLQPVRGLGFGWSDWLAVGRLLLLLLLVF